MATIKKNQFRARQFGGVTPFGNTTMLPFVLKTTAAGAAIDASSTAAIGDGDSIVLGVLPAGMLLADATLKVSTAFTALVVGKLGFAYADGVDSADVPQDDDYFAAAATLHTVGVYRQSTAVAPVRLPKEANLVLVCSGAANAKAAQLDVIVTGELTGPN